MTKRFLLLAVVSGAFISCGQQGSQSETKKDVIIQAGNGDNTNKKDHSELPVSKGDTSSEVIQGPHISKGDTSSEFADRLTEITSQFNAIFRANDLMTEVKMWWSKTQLTDGVARGNSSRYLQYNKTLEIVKADIIQMERFEKKLTDLGAPPQTSAVVQEQIDAFKVSLERVLNETEAGGWQGFYNSQNVMVTAREAQIGPPPLGCRPLLKEFRRLQKIKEPADINEFATFEKAYLPIPDVCGGRIQSVRND